DAAPPAPPARPRLTPWAPALLFLGERTFVRGNARSVAHYVESAVKVDEKHHLAAATGKAGTPHITVGFGFPEKDRDKIRQQMRRELANDRQAEPWSGVALAGLRPLLMAKQAVLTADLGLDSRIESSLQFDDARAAARGRDGVQLAQQLLKGGLTYLEDELAQLDRASAVLLRKFFDT